MIMDAQAAAPIMDFVAFHVFRRMDAFSLGRRTFVERGKHAASALERGRSSRRSTAGSINHRQPDQSQVATVRRYLKESIQIKGLAINQIYSKRASTALRLG
jgi:hypothetical protein